MKHYLPFWCYYLHQGMITALTLQGVPGYFRHAGLDLAQLSWLSLCMLPWVAKFLWAPWGERHALAMRGNPYLGSLVLLQLGMALLLAGIGLLSPNHSIKVIVTALMALTLFSASHDIYADGITISVTNVDNRPYANTAQVGGSYLGILFGSFAFLAIAQRLGWTWGFLGLAGLSLALLLPPILLISEAHTPRTLKHAKLNLSDITELWPALALTAIYYLAIRGMMALQTVVLVDQGLSLTALGETLTVYSTLASGVGVLLGGWLARSLGARRCLLPVITAHAALATMLAVGYPHYGLVAWMVLFGMVNVAAAAGFVTLYNALMGLVRPQQPASDYALFQSADAAIAMLTTMGSLRLASYTGYRPVLALLALFAMASLWPTRRLLHRLSLPR